MSKAITAFKETWSMYLPFCLFFPCWLLVGSREGIFAEAISTYWPMMLAMVIGSMIAGSTPLGGGVIAFPVSVTVLGFQSTMGRDFSLMIQSFGMSSATFLIFFRKSHLLEGKADLLCSFAFFSAVGLAIGLGVVSAVLTGYVVNLIYATVVVCLVLVFIYEDILVRKEVSKDSSTTMNDIEEEGEDEEEQYPQDNQEQHSNRSSRRRSTLSQAVMELAVNIDPAAADPPEDTGKGTMKSNVVKYLFLPFFGILGGILSSQIGSGTDIAFYFYGSILNSVEGEHGGARMSGNTLTAISVIEMATMSVFGSLLRITSHADPELVVYPEVYLCLFAVSPIVTLGAPTGSLFLKPAYEQYLKLLFYALGFAQLVVFGLLEFKDDGTAWLVIGCSVAAVLLIIFTHYFISYKIMKDDQEPVEGSARRSRPSLLAATL